MTNKTAIRPHTRLTPTFKKGGFLFLTKDSNAHSEIAYEFDPTNDYFKENCVFVVI